MAATILWPPGMTRPYSRPRKDVVWIRRVMANHASFAIWFSRFAVEVARPAFRGRALPRVASPEPMSSRPFRVTIPFAKK